MLTTFALFVFGLQYYAQTLILDQVLYLLVNKMTLVDLIQANYSFILICVKNLLKGVKKRPNWLYVNYLVSHLYSKEYQKLVYLLAIIRWKKTNI